MERFKWQKMTSFHRAGTTKVAVKSRGKDRPKRKTLRHPRRTEGADVTCWGGKCYYQSIPDWRKFYYQSGPDWPKVYYLSGSNPTICQMAAL